MNASKLLLLCALLPITIATLQCTIPGFSNLCVAGTAADCCSVHGNMACQMQNNVWCTDCQCMTPLAHQPSSIPDCSYSSSFPVNGQLNIHISFSFSSKAGVKYASQTKRYIDSSDQNKWCQFSFTGGRLTYLSQSRLRISYNDRCTSTSAGWTQECTCTQPNSADEMSWEILYSKNLMFGDNTIPYAPDNLSCVLPPSTPGSGGLGVWLYVCIGGGAVLVLVVGYLVHRRKKERGNHNYQLQGDVHYNPPIASTQPHYAQP